MNKQRIGFDTNLDWQQLLSHTVNHANAGSLPVPVKDLNYSLIRGQLENPTACFGTEINDFEIIAGPRCGVS